MGEPFSTPPNDNDPWQIAGKVGDEDGRAGRILKNPSARSRRDDSKHEVEIPNAPSDNAKVFDTVLNEEAGRLVRELSFPSKFELAVAHDRRHTARDERSWRGVAFHVIAFHVQREEDLLDWHEP